MQASGASMMRRLPSVIHPPLPMTPRQTSQLLASLTSSFQRYLDQAHPEPRLSKPVVHSSVALSQARCTPNASLSSFYETANHFDSIISHPAFAGLQQSPAQSGSKVDQPAFRILRAVEQKLKYGKLTVFEAADLFRVMYNLAIAADAKPGFSFASRFIALLRSSGTNASQQFFSITGLAAKWVRLMFHEQREQEIWPLTCNINSTYQILPHYLSAILRTRGMNALVEEMQRIDEVAKSGNLVLSDACINKSILFIQHNLLKLHRQGITMSESGKSKTFEQIQDTIFGSVPSIQTGFLLAVSKLVLDGDASQMVSFDKSLQTSEASLDYWTETKNKRRLLLDATLKAAAMLCEHEQAEQSQEKHADAQLLLQFSEIVFAEELQISDRQRRHSQADAELQEAQRKPREDAVILSRLDGLLPA